MRIGFDLSVVRHGLNNGSAVYAYRLLEAILRLRSAPETRVYFGARGSEASDILLDQVAANGVRVVYGNTPWRWSPDAAWWLPAPPVMRELIRSVDVFHAGEMIIPPRSTTPFVASVYDLTTRLFPEQHTYWNRRLHARRLDWMSRHAERVLVCSVSTKRDLQRLYNFPSDRVDLIYGAPGHDVPAVESGFEAGKHALERLSIGSAPYILSVGTPEPRKNHERLIRAFEQLCSSYPDLLLVFAGGRGWHGKTIRHVLESSIARERIRVLGLVPQDSLHALYAGAIAFAFPSLYEGFGLPVLEAMAAGVPVLTSGVSSLPELAEGAAILVNPSSVDEIRDGLARLVSDPSLRERLIEQGAERAKTFTWERTAELAVQSYRRALESSGVHVVPRSAFPEDV